MTEEFEMVIGLEVHAELSTESKLFCSCSTAFGGEPNTHCCPVCLGYPGTLPVLNRAAVEKTVTAGLALGSTIAARSKMDRKNYFYPDLPKAYQISQYDEPLALGGRLEIQTGTERKTVRLTRIHLEEDAGKLTHDGAGTQIDGNRCGIPLIEIVTEPDLRSAAEAVAFLRKLRAVLRATGVAACRMEEGGMRCDVNLSVRPVGEEKLGTRAEIKNLNSFASVTAAITAEFKRQCELLLSGGEMVQETRRFDLASGKTLSMRSKEDADDYRYFPEPDLPPVAVDSEMLERARAAVPELPDSRAARFVATYGMTDGEAARLTDEPMLADYYEAVLRACGKSGEEPAVRRVLLSCLLTEFPRLLSPEESEIPLSPVRLAELLTMQTKEQISGSAAKKVLSEIFRSGEAPSVAAERLSLFQISDPLVLSRLLREAIAASPRGMEDYRRGKTAALKSYVGAVMAKTEGRANPAVTAKLLSGIADEVTG